MTSEKLKEKKLDETWEEIYQSRKWGKYPPEELVRFIARNFYKKPDKKAIKILDMGCGTGAGTWYIAREGFSVYGIDWSKSAIETAKQRFQEEKLEGEFVVGDIQSLKYPNEFFDAVVDICAIQHNNNPGIKAILSETYRVLKKEGKFFSMLTSKNSWGSVLGEEFEKNTFRNISNGPYSGKGVTHFFEENEVKKLLINFDSVEINLSTRTEQNKTKTIEHFVVEVTK